MRTSDGVGILRHVSPKSSLTSRIDLSLSERRLLRKPVGERIRHARQTLDLSQREFGEAIGANRLQVLKWEGGWYRPRFRHRAAMAEVSGLPLEFFKHDGPEGNWTYEDVAA